MRDRRRLKAVMEEEDKKVCVPGDPLDLDLGLSLGRGPRGGAGSSSDNAAGSRKRGSLVDYASDTDSDEDAWRCLESGSAWTESFRDDADFDVHFSRKRARAIVDDAELYNIAASSSGGEAYGPAVTMDSASQSSIVKTESETVTSLSNNSRRFTDSNDGGGIKLDSSDSRDNDDTAIGMDLTEDLLLLVFSFLGPKDLCKAGATCKHWRAASMHEEFWRCLNFENTMISLENFETICHQYPNATEANLIGVPNSDALATIAMSSLRRFETLILGNANLGDAFFHALNECHTLKSLSICDSSLGSGIQEIVVRHDDLRTLNITKCRVYRLSVRCPQLQSLSLRRSSMVNALLACPQLHELDIASCYKLTDAGIQSAAITCPLLSSLNISSCSSVTNESLREIASSCPNLRVLDASYCPNISLETVRLPMLKDLKLHSCEGVTSASISAISHSRVLEALQLDNCGQLASVFLDLRHLQSISLVHCRKFVDLNLRSPVLSYINISNCSSLRHISITSNVLQKLVLQKLESLATLMLNCANLQEVDLSDCESLKDSVFQVFSDGGGCPMLSSLILDYCESLTMVGLNCSSLVFLSLVRCRGMTSLDLSCPNLQRLNLDGCDHLERASFSPIGLESLNLGICPKLGSLQIEAPRMSVLELKGCGVLSVATINCPCLMSLDASFCRQFMDASLSGTAASCPKIESILLSSCVSVGYDGLSSLHWLKHLTVLDLSYTFLSNLQPIFDSCFQLVIFKLSACKYLTNTSLEPLYKEGALPALRELDLSYSSITQCAISQLLASCTNLVNLNFNGCANMHDLTWGSSNLHSSDMENIVETFGKSDGLLETLNCIGCPNIERVLIPSSASCFHLSKLNLNLSANLKEVDISCISLNSLNLSNCSMLKILKLDCPRLANLQLLGCSMLEPDIVEAALFRCPMLETLNLVSCPKINDAIVGICPRGRLKRIQCS